ncbi:hypothetical protein HEK131_21180 [Streptomyces seoulensis]|nr:hypothetical protein HEK131_21180 [Streptomyces seoulensis]
MAREFGTASATAGAATKSGVPHDNRSALTCMFVQSRKLDADRGASRSGPFTTAHRTERTRNALTCTFVATCAKPQVRGLRVAYEPGRFSTTPNLHGRQTVATL